MSPSKKTFISKNKTSFPSKEEILSFLETASFSKISKREIARAFNIKGNDRQRLKALLQEMMKEELLEKEKGRSLRKYGTLPAYCPVDIIGLTQEGFPIGRAIQEEDREDFSSIYFLNPMPKGDNLAIGDRILAKLEKGDKPNSYKGSLVRPIEQPTKEIIALYRESPKTGPYVVPTDLRLDESYPVDPKFTHQAKPGDLVRVLLREDFASSKRRGRPRASQNPVRILHVLGHESDPKLFSLIVIHALGIPTTFQDKSLEEAEQSTVPPLGKRQDLRSYPLVTIDGEDARDFDDAIWAERDTDPKNPGGFHLIVAIADVAYYVRSGSSLEQDAYERGNSVYFPDRVVPMLPEGLSNNLCSLKPNEDRASLVCHLWISSTGSLSSFHFARALIKSHARLTYTQVQAFLQGHTESLDLPDKVKELIPILYEAYKVLSKDRALRGTLDLDLPERQVCFDTLGRVEKIVEKPRYESNKLIEEFMIAANVAAATFLANTSLPCMYRVHDTPAFDKIEILRSVLKPIGLGLPPHGQINPKDLNKLLHQTRQTPQELLVNQLVLRSQSQAVYSPRNIGHYGLGLEKYAHFTSPIRRYSDLLIHRAIISALSLGQDGLPEGTSFETFEEIGFHISQTERRAMQAERDTMSRYLISYMEDHIRAEFEACISGVTRAGLFIEVLENGANGFIPMRLLPYDRYMYSEKTLSLKGAHGTSFKLGDFVRVQLVEANSLTNNLVFRVVEFQRQKRKEEGTKARGKYLSPKARGKRKRK